jgi:hypothetical protein
MEQVAAAFQAVLGQELGMVAWVRLIVHLEKTALPRV